MTSTLGSHPVSKEQNDKQPGYVLYILKHNNVRVNQEYFNV